MEQIKFSYKKPTLKIILCVLFFGAITVFIINDATTNTKGLIINHTIELSPNSATIFSWALAIASGLFTLGGIYAMFAGINSKEIILTNNEISVPKAPISKKIVTIKYSDITGLNIKTVQKIRFLNITYRDGKLAIPSNCLAKGDFDKIVELISSKVTRKSI